MKKILTIALLLSSTFVYAQQQKGIRFQHGLTWAQVKQKAKAEHKYIFVDGFTTWCVPCRMMANTIFPQQKTGDFFNKNFINISLQFDRTKKDNAEVRRWYNDAKIIQTTYKVSAYPTFLFFNPDGDLVHTIIGGTNSADDFIAKSKPALDPATQFSGLQKQFEEGNKESQFLLKLIKAARQTNNGVIEIAAINTYLASQKDLLTDQNLKFIAKATSKSTDPGFDVLLNHADKLDAAAGEGKSALIINDIAFDEILLPEFRKDGKKTDYGGGMVMYSGEVNKSIDWAAVQSKVAAKYPNQANDIITCGKPIYYQWLGDWPQFVIAVNAYTLKPKGFDYQKLNNFFAWTVYTSSDDKECIKAAMSWAKIADEADTSHNPGYKITYANLLYKSGEKDEAIKSIEKIIATYPTTKDELSQQLDKMKKGENIW
jgi:thioredoxin-related protein/tetratricopeptide (TPR) repeat protein